MADTKTKTLDKLTDEEYSAVKQDGAARLDSLIKGDIVINRSKDYLLSLKKEIRKALSHGYTYADIAKVLRDESKGITFTTRQIREFCEEQGLNTDGGKTGSSRKKGGLNKAKTGSQNQVSQDHDDDQPEVMKKHSNDEDIAEI